MWRRIGFAFIVTGILVCAQSASASVTLGTANTTSLSSGLVGYWTFDGPSLNWKTGTVADMSGHGNTGQLVGMSTTTSPTIGKIGQALKFNGTSSYISVPNSSFVSPASITISFWFKQPSLDASTIMGLVNKDVGSIGPPYALQIAANSRALTFLVTNSANAAFTISSSNLTLGVWHHAVGIFNSATQTMTLYIDGAQASSGAASDIGATSGNLNIGQQKAGFSRYFNGTLDDVRIYNRALSATEVALLYAAGQAHVGDASVVLPAVNLLSGLVGYWPLNEGSGTVTRDYSTSGNTGTLVGSPTWTSGKYGKALSFNGSSNYVTIPDPSNIFSFLSSTNFTVSLWVKPTSIASGAFIGKGTTDYWYVGFSSNSLYARMSNGGAINRSLGSVIPTNKWSFVVAVFGSHAAPLIYANGVNVTNNSVSNVPFPTLSGSLTLGELNGGTFYSGAEDDVHIYNRALSAAEVKQLYMDEGVNIDHSNTVTLSTGLVGHWITSGNAINWKTSTIADTSGNGNTGTLVGMSTTTSPTIGKIGQALKFNGSSSIISNFLSSISPAGSSRTICAWFRTSSAAREGLVGARNFSGVGFVFDVNNGGAGNLGYFHTGGNSLTVSAGITPGKWYDACATYNATTLVAALYLNGTLLGSQGSFSADAANAFNGVIGDESIAGNGAANHLFAGTIDDVRIYNRALSAQEVQQLYLMGK
jgi:hypothetical protein